MFRTFVPVVFLCATLLGACNNPSAPGDILVVVQETNMPCNQETCPSCDSHEYELEVVRMCRPGLATVHICSPEPVCDQALESLSDMIEACAEPGPRFEYDGSDCP